MVLLLLEFLSQHGWKVPAAFSYCSTRMVLAAITTLVCTIFLGPRFIRTLYSLKIGQSIRVEDCPILVRLHEGKRETPSMGGILILCAMLLALLLWMDLRSVFTLILLATTVCLGLIGGIDDYLKLKYKHAQGLSGKKKLGLQVLFSTLVGLYLFWAPLTNRVHSGRWFVPPIAKEQSVGTLRSHEYIREYYLPFCKQPVFALHMALGILFSAFVITGASNAVNLADGLDGLAAGCVILVSLVLALFAFISNHLEIANYLNILYIKESGEIAIYLSGLIGACLGFLWFNGYPAQVFMGDTGSLALGGVLGVSSVLLRRELLLALVGGVFVAEALSVILQVGSYKFLGRKRIFLCAPLHHHFEYKGWPETKVVLRFWIIGLLLALIGISSIKLQ